jgi:hypothetical protein
MSGLLFFMDAKHGILQTESQWACHHLQTGALGTF